MGTTWKRFAWSDLFRHCAPLIRPFGAPSPGGEGGDWETALLSRRVGLTGGGPSAVITTLGRSSLFVYWIHVEMVYGVVAEQTDLPRRILAARVRH